LFLPTLTQSLGFLLVPPLSCRLLQWLFWFFHFESALFSLCLFCFCCPDYPVTVGPMPHTIRRPLGSTNPPLLMAELLSSPLGPSLLLCGRVFVTRVFLCILSIFLGLPFVSSPSPSVGTLVWCWYFFIVLPLAQEHLPSDVRLRWGGFRPFVFFCYLTCFPQLL